MYEWYWLNRRLKVSAGLRNRLRSNNDCSSFAGQPAFEPEHNTHERLTRGPTPGLVPCSISVGAACPAPTLPFYK